MPTLINTSAYLGLVETSVSHRIHLMDHIYGFLSMRTSIKLLKSLFLFRLMMSCSKSVTKGCLRGGESQGVCGTLLS